MNVLLTREHLTLDLEILPHMLQQAHVLRDLDGDGQMSQAELGEAKAAILRYVQEHVGITVNQRALRADSAAVMYRLQDAVSAPTRVYVTCWYALLLKPEHLRLRNEMFQAFAATHKNYGTITSGKQVVDFEFPTEAAFTGPGVEFKIFAHDVEWINDAATSYSPALIWLTAGCSGLLALGMIARFRKLARRRARRSKRMQHTSTVAVSPRSYQQAYELEKVL
ncbi:hypothetical protein HUU05_13285, partial [candidate division KSB1 bacterium]|nr:hypothetical protein [candidate division KSB1 bacterium]